MVLKTVSFIQYHLIYMKCKLHLWDASYMMDIVYISDAVHLA